VSRAAEALVNVDISALGLGLALLGAMANFCYGNLPQTHKSNNWTRRRLDQGCTDFSENVW